MTATVTQCVILVDGAAPTEPSLASLVRDLMRFGVTDVLLSAAAPLPTAALTAIQAVLPHPIDMTVAEGGALEHARSRLDERFLLCDGGCRLDFNLARLLAAAATQPGPRIALHAVPDTGGRGRVTMEGGWVTAFDLTMQGGPGLVGAGVALLDRGMLDRLALVHSLEGDVLPALVAAGVLQGTVVTRTERPSRPALMLDRDGTINRDHGWVGTRDRWEWIDGAMDAICAATDAGWHVFVVTNQSGIARGYYDEAALDALHRWMTDEIRRAGGTVDDIRFCPFHAEAGIGRYRRASDWRKPEPGMILDLVARWRLDPARCVLVGDQPSDMAAAMAAGIRGQPFGGGNLLETVQPLLSGFSSSP